MPQQDWSDAETWVWEQVRAGEKADFNQRFGPANPKAAKDWDDARRLSTAFIRCIFHDRSLREEIPPEGVRVIGAWFSDRLTLPHARLRQQCWLGYCRFGRGADLSNHTTEGHLSLEGSFFPKVADDAPALALDGSRISGQLNLSGAMVAGKLTMNGVQVGQNLVMGGSKEQPATFAEVDLMGADVKGQLSLIGATVTGTLTMNGVQVGRSLFMRGSAKEPATFEEVDLMGADVKDYLDLTGATFAKVRLAGADVKGQLSLTGATVTGKLTMNGVQVGQDLSMLGSKEQPATFEEVDLTGADVKGELSLTGATVKGKLNMEGVQVGRNLLMRGSKEQPATFTEVRLTRAQVKNAISLGGASLEGKLSLDRATVGADFYLKGATAGILNLSGSKIAGELNLLSIKWARVSHLDLHNAHASVLSEDSTNWPPWVTLELDGFTYDRMTGIGGHEEMGLGLQEWCERRIERWLELDRTYTPPPYAQLASVLRKAGEPAKASAVLYESRERARCHERERYLSQQPARVESRTLRTANLLLPGWYGWRHTGLMLLRSTIGYGLGLRYFWCLRWIAGLTALGWVVLQLDAENIHLGKDVIYSFQRLLPSFAKFEEFPSVTLGRFATGYFYIHQLAGYVLAGFLGAGLAGLTQKS